MQLLPDFQRRKRTATIREIAALLRDVKDREKGVCTGETPRKALQAGWPPIDNALAKGGLASSATHEFLSQKNPIAGRTSQGHTPALGVLTHLARRALDSEPAPGEAGASLNSDATGGLPASAAGAIASGANTSGIITWIGRAVWPNPQSLIDPDNELLQRSIFIDARTKEERVWATDLSLR